MGIIVPKTYISELDVINIPTIFLAGPIKGAPNWRREAAQFLFSQKPDILVASPQKELGENLEKSILKGREDVFQRQRAWERYYLRGAANRGAILFWLPREIEHNCEKSYGAMTRKELGDWSTLYKIFGDAIRFCIGTDGKFSEIDTLLYDLSQDAPNKVIYNTLEETCLEALRLSNP